MCRGGGLVLDYLVIPQGFESFPSDLSQVGWHNLVYLECLHMVKPMVVGGVFVHGQANGGWLCSIGG